MDEIRRKRAENPCFPQKIIFQTNLYFTNIFSHCQSVVAYFLHVFLSRFFLQKTQKQFPQGESHVLQCLNLALYSGLQRFLELSIRSIFAFQKLA